MSEFEKWYINSKYQLSNDTTRRYLYEAWQAAKADSEREIALLKVKIGDTEQKYQEKLNELTENFEELELNYDQLNIDYCLVRDNRDEKIKQITALQTHINVLREALEIAVEYQRSDVANFHSAYAGYEDEKHEQYDYDLKLVENALSSTPAQSLQEHDNEMIERVVTLLKDWTWGDGIIDMLADDLIEDVRKLKVEV